MASAWARVPSPKISSSFLRIFHCFFLASALLSFCCLLSGWIIRSRGYAVRRCVSSFWKHSAVVWRSFRWWESAFRTLGAELFFQFLICLVWLDSPVSDWWSFISFGSLRWFCSFPEAAVGVGGRMCGPSRRCVCSSPSVQNKWTSTFSCFGGASWFWYAGGWWYQI